ncbi:hypothetical protein ACQPX6_06675 [Actinomycetospora sp. CA-101289]|uniref:hypothetical protein n=1 Tax=Actinomycetospora sp. CA-101289 TaxID=3239893 RepID=UPI003D9674EF
MATIPHDTHAAGEQVADADGARVRIEHTGDDAALRVFRTAQWVPPAYREAYLEGAARVLGHAPLAEG